MANLTKAQKEEKRRAALTPDERAAEDKKEEERRAALSPEEREAEDKLKEGGDKPPKVTPEPGEEMVQVKKSDLDRIIKTMDSQAKDIDLLYKTADKSRLARELNKEGENLIKQAKVSTWEDTGKLIIGWRLITNKCEVVMGKWIEEQTVTIMFDGGETITVSLLEFYRKTLKKVEADIMSRTQEADGSITFKLQFPNGKVLLLGSAYVN